MSRLRLNFNLKTPAERLNFINNYLPSLPNPTSEELETISNYLLWASESNSPRKDLKSRGILPPSKSNDWDEKVESLEALYENPAVDESDFKPLTAIPTRIAREPFSRSKARQEAPAFIRDTLEALFLQIDELDYKIELYELKTGKRTEPIRETLISRLDLRSRARAEEEIAHWEVLNYIRARHFLIQLRSDQYTIRDSYKQNVGASVTAKNIGYSPVDEPIFGDGIDVKPLGLLQHSKDKEKTDITELIFYPAPSPSRYTSEQLKKISAYIWDYKKKLEHQGTRIYFDFENEDHIYQLLLLERTLKKIDITEDSTINSLVETLDYYIQEANLSEIQRRILDMKRAHKENYDIAQEVNKEFGKHYAQNYISTIFKQKIIPKIIEAVKLHKEKIENLFFEEEFKKCSCCGRELLRREDFFMRRERSLDGLNGRCKDCDREKRKEKKKNNE